MSLSLVLNEIDTDSRIKIAENVVRIMENGLDLATSQAYCQLYDYCGEEQLSVSYQKSNYFLGLLGYLLTRRSLLK